MVQEEQTWVRAKSLAREAGRPTDWAYTITLYNYLGGTEKAVDVTVDDVPFRLVGEYTRTKAILYKDNEFLLVDSGSVYRGRKTFIDTSGELVDTLDPNSLDSLGEEITNMNIKTGKPIGYYS